MESMCMAPLLLTSLPQCFLHQSFVFFLLSPHSLSCFLFSSSFFRGKLPIQHFLRPSIKHLWRWEQEEQCLEQTVVHFTEILGSYMTFPWFCSPGSRHGSRGVLCTSGSHAKLSMGCFYIWETLLLNCNIKKKEMKKKALENHFAFSRGNFWQ